MKIPDASAAPSCNRDEGDEPRLRDLLDFGGDSLSAIERWQIGFMRRSFEPGMLDRAIRGLQRHVGANWIEASIRNLRLVYGRDRLPTFDPAKSYVVVSNHRSFFDLYVVTAYLVKQGMAHRLVFPVRSNFFYDTPAGFVVNGIMSFFAMYPPVFRERHRAMMNLASLDEVVRLLRRGGAFVGLHPEGTRNQSVDPYALLPAQGGVGRIIHASRAEVIPAFINGLGNDIVKQVASNYTKKGTPVTVVFGAPVDFGDMLDAPASPKHHKRISEHALDAIRKLGEEERAIRATLC
ncbi:MAG: 1-acyl-sn-glycerol-3-phosphate acyltransferase [Polyangiaceae bacterium]|nr:1-acyl-sn-glycerol-3-phosphate acyltransferase [Polyangiaceae bacterium]